MKIKRRDAQGLHGSAISFLRDYIYTYPPTHAYYIIYNMMALGTNGTNYKNLLLWQK